MKLKPKKNWRLKVGEWITKLAWDASQRIEIFLINLTSWLVKKEKRLDGFQSKDIIEVRKNIIKPLKTSGSRLAVGKNFGSGRTTKRKNNGSRK